MTWSNQNRQKPISPFSFEFLGFHDVCLAVRQVCCCAQPTSNMQKDDSDPHDQCSVNLEPGDLFKNSNGDKTTELLEDYKLSASLLYAFLILSNNY
jgi:hypothetical protein